MAVQPQLASKPGGIFFLGEAPSDEEMVKGYPLVGPSGNLLARALRSARLTDPSPTDRNFLPNLTPETRHMLWERRAHSFSNVFDTQLPKNDVKHWCWPARDREGYLRWMEELGGSQLTEYQALPRIGSAGFLRPEFTHHLDRLASEIAQTKPSLIVPLGGTALWALTGLASIDDYRGAVGTADFLAPGTKIVPTYHPAFILQNYKKLTVLIADLIKAKYQSGFPEVRSEDIELWLEPNLSDLDEFFQQHVLSADLLSVDIETGGGQISCLTFSTSPTTGIVVPFVDYRDPTRSYWETAAQEIQAWEWVKKVLELPIPKLMQNGGSFDMFWFLDVLGSGVANYTHDLRLVSKILFPEMPASLKYLGATYTNLPAWKAGVSHQDQTKRDA